LSTDYPLPFKPGHGAPPTGDAPALHFAFQGRRLLVTLGNALPGSFDGLDVVRSQFLGEHDGTPCISAELKPGAEPPEGHRFSDLRRLFGRLDPSLLAIAGRAVQIVEWDRTHQFCGACGGPTELSASDRSRQCPSCRVPMYPRLAPAMIVSVERGDQILLARSPHFPPGIYSMLAGFVEPGESAEEAVIREVFEETRIVVQDVRYFGSQPWPFPNSLMLGFIAQYKSGEIDVTEDELEDAGWYDAGSLPKTFPGNVSISQWLLKDYRKRQAAGVRT
jgi:NAD+ diphosphatase